MEYLVLTLIGGSILFIIFLFLPIKISVPQKILFVGLAITFSHLFLWLEDSLPLWQAGLIITLLILITALGTTKILYKHSEQERKDNTTPNEKVQQEQKHKADGFETEDNIPVINTIEENKDGSEQLILEQVEEPTPELQELSGEVTSKVEENTKEEHDIHQEKPEEIGPNVEQLIDETQGEDQLLEQDSSEEIEEILQTQEEAKEEIDQNTSLEVQQLADEPQEDETEIVEVSIEELDSMEEIDKAEDLDSAEELDKAEELETAEEIDSAEELDSAKELDNVEELDFDDKGDNELHEVASDEQITTIDEKAPVSIEEIDQNVQPSPVKKQLNRALMDTLIEQLHWYKLHLKRDDFEKLVLDHAKENLHDNDYYLFASVLRDHYIETEQFDKLKNLLNKLKQRYNSKMVIKEEIIFFENKFFQS